MPTILLPLAWEYSYIIDFTILHVIVLAEFTSGLSELCVYHLYNFKGTEKVRMEERTHEWTVERLNSISIQVRFHDSFLDFDFKLVG